MPTSSLCSRRNPAGDTTQCQSSSCSMRKSSSAFAQIIEYRHTSRKNMSSLVYASQLQPRGAKPPHVPRLRSPSVNRVLGALAKMMVSLPWPGKRPSAAHNCHSTFRHSLYPVPVPCTLLPKRRRMLRFAALHESRSCSRRIVLLTAGVAASIRRPHPLRKEQCHPIVSSNPNSAGAGALKCGQPPEPSCQLALHARPASVLFHHAAASPAPQHAAPPCCRRAQPFQSNI